MLKVVEIYFEPVQDNVELSGSFYFEGIRNLF